MILVLLILGLDVSMLAVTCLQHLYQGRFEAHHSIFDLQGEHHHSEPLSDEADDDCKLTSASNDDMLLVPVEHKPCLPVEQAVLFADQPFESLITSSPLGILKIYHSPPVKPPTL